MCTIVQQPPSSANWNDVVVVTGTGFSSAGVISLANLAGAPITGGIVGTTAWSDTSISVLLAPATLPADGSYRLAITPLLGTPCTTNAIAISAAPACTVTATPAS